MATTEKNVKAKTTKTETETTETEEPSLTSDPINPAIDPAKTAEERLAALTEQREEQAQS